MLQNGGARKPQMWICRWLPGLHICTREVSKAAPWGCQIQRGSLRRSLIILESVLETIFQQLLLLNSLPPSPSFIVKSGAGVLFLGSAWIVKAGLGAEISIDNPFIRESEAQSDLWGTRILLSDLPAIVLLSSTKDELKERSPLHLDYERSKARLWRGPVGLFSLT